MWCFVLFIYWTAHLFGCFCHRCNSQSSCHHPHLSSADSAVNSAGKSSFYSRVTASDLFCILQGLFMCLFALCVHEPLFLGAPLRDAGHWQGHLFPLMPSRCILTVLGVTEAICFKRLGGEMPECISTASPSSWCTILLLGTEEYNFTSLNINRKCVK